MASGVLLPWVPPEDEAKDEIVAKHIQSHPDCPVCAWGAAYGAGLLRAYGLGPAIFFGLYDSSIQEVNDHPDMTKEWMVWALREAAKVALEREGEQ